MLQNTRTCQRGWKEAHSLMHMPLRSWCTVCQRAKGQQNYHKTHQKASSVIQLDHSFYKIQGGGKSQKAHVSVEMIASMSGAVIAPDLSANPVAIKALKQFIVVNSFTKSVIQCDGHSGLLRLQEQVGREMSLPTQVWPSYCHQCQGIVERFRKTLYGQVRAIRIGLADQLRIHAYQVDGSLLPWIINMQLMRSTTTSSGQMAEPHTRWSSISTQNHPLAIVHFGERVPAPIQSQPPAQKLQIRSSPQKSLTLWLGKDIVPGMHIVSPSDGQVRKTRTITRFIGGSVQCNRIQEVQNCYSWVKCYLQGEFIWSDVVQRSRSEVLTSAKEQCQVWVSRISSQVVHSSGLLAESAASSAEGATSPSARWCRDLQSQLQQVFRLSPLQDYLNLSSSREGSLESKHLQNSRSTWSSQSKTAP